MKGKIHDEKHEQGRKQRLEDRDNHVFAAVLFECGKFEKFARAECDKRKRDVGKKAHPLHHSARNDLQAVRTYENARDDIAGDVGKSEHLRHARHQISRKQHNRD